MDVRIPKHCGDTLNSPIGSPLAELLLVCAGFDAAKGDPMGEFNVSPQCFGILTSMLLPLAKGKVVLSLEGGYNPPVVGNCVLECMNALLGVNKEIPVVSPLPQTIRCVQNVKQIHSKYWKCFQ